VGFKGVLLRIAGGIAACMIIGCAAARPVTVSKLYSDQKLQRDHISSIFFQSPITDVFIDGNQIKNKSNWNRIEFLPGKRKLVVYAKKTDRGRVLANVVGVLSAIFVGYGEVGDQHRTTRSTIELDARPGFGYVLGTRSISDRTVVANVQAAFPFTAATQNGSKTIRLSVADYKKMVFQVLVEGKDGSVISDWRVPLKHIRTAGKRIAFAVNHAGKARMFLDGRVGAPYDAIGAPYFDPTGARLAYRAKQGTGMLMVVDGKEGNHYDVVGYPVFSPDGSRLGYQVLFAGVKWLMVVDGKAGPAFDRLGYLRFSPDGKRSAYAAQRGKKWLMVVDGEEKGLFHKIGNPFFSSDSRRIAYFVEADNKRSVFIDGIDGKRYDDVSDPIFSPDGKSVVYWSETGGRWHVVRDGKEGKSYDAILRGTPLFSPDSRYCAYGARAGKKWFVVVDEKEGFHYDAISWERRPVITFSPDGQSVYYQARVDSFVSGREWLEVSQLIK